MVAIKVRKAPSTHSFDWVVTVGGTVIEGFGSRYEAIEVGTMMADKTGSDLMAQRPDGRWGRIRRGIRYGSASGSESTADSDKDETSLVKADD